ncbi:centrosome-associated protein 350 [Lampris incognitus]|uniref:centrosome-associated protein 350 n=1 Tax=Lampris incognitus TaxID=2546036 RepID=UPI0024B4DFCC|nr:centrosome-associated protein 350 [Lampris incognitus]
MGSELTAAWKSLAQSKAALRHIENHLEVAPGTGVLLDSVMDSKKSSSGSSRKVSRRGRQVDDMGGSPKWRGRDHQSPEKSSSRSPLRNTTQDSNVRRNNNVEFREPLASYREATPPPLLPSQLEAYSRQSVPGLSYPSSQSVPDPLLSHLVYQRDTRDIQTARDLDSTHSSALDGTEVRYLNDRPALDALRTLVQPKAQLTQSMDSEAAASPPAPVPGSIGRDESSASSSPASASQKLENLRRRQPDNKLEKLKERIRRQREHLEKAAERDRLLGYLEQPILGAVDSSIGVTTNMPTAKIRKVAAAPPAPVYRGFNSSETKIKTPDGKVWKEEEFHNLSREIYRDLSQRFSESTRSRHQQQREQRPADRSKERKPSKPVRKVQKVASGSDTRPVIGPSSWREGQKLVKMVLGPAPRLPKEDKPQPSDRLSKTGPFHRSSSDPRSESNRQSHRNSRERSHSSSQGRSNSHSMPTPISSAAAQDKAPVAVSTDLLSADIQGILDDLQLECRAAEEEEERARQRSRRGDRSRRGRGGSGSLTRASVSALGSIAAAGNYLRGSRSTSPAKHQPEPVHTTETGQRKRHYDADSVRQYIVRQQEERKRRQAEEKRAQREEAERRNQRLQELYKKQRGVGKALAHPPVVPVAPVQKRLQETYTKLLLEEAQLGAEATQTQPTVLPTSSQLLQKPVYQPSGESDKENKRLEPPQSPSSSDMSLSEHPPPPLSRNDLGVGVPSWLQPGLNSAVRPASAPSSSALVPPSDHLLSQLLRLEAGASAGGHRQVPEPTTAPPNRLQSKMSRIEALKATAASLSQRIESEARKLAGEGINYGSATALDVDAIFAPQPSQMNHDDGRWAKAFSPPVRETAIAATTDPDDLALRIQRILCSAGQSSYNAVDLPFVGNLAASEGTFRRQKEKNGLQTNFFRLETTAAGVGGHTLNNETQEGRTLVNGLEKGEKMERLGQGREYGTIEGEEMNGKKPEHHESSGGSISEGPLLSEGSLSEDDADPPRHSHNHIAGLADRLGAQDFCVGQRGDYQPLSHFQREAERYSPFSLRDGSKQAWEELNKGSPLSVINIFTKTLHSHVKVGEDKPEKRSPSVRSVQSGASPGDVATYENDFVSTRSSGTSGQSKRGHNNRSVNSHFEELKRRSPYEKRARDLNSLHSSIQSPHLSCGSTPGSSPLSRGSTGKRGASSDRHDATVVDEQRSPRSPTSEAPSAESKKRGSEKNSVYSQARSIPSDGTLGGASGYSLRSFGLDGNKSPVDSPSQASPSGSPPGADSPDVSVRSGSSVGADIPNIGLGLRSGSPVTPEGRPAAVPGTHIPRPSGRAETTSELQYAPTVLQQRMTAELTYLESVEESLRQLGDVERLRGVSMAQQESVSLAQILKAQQQRHERELYELKIKAEREALEAQLQLEESRHRAVRAHADLQESMAVTQQETLGGLQESTAKMMTQQVEAARYTADAARHIKEMTELARSQIAGALIVPSAVTSLLDQQREQHNMKQLQAKADTERSEVSGSRAGPEEPPSPLDSCSQSDSLPSRRPNLSDGDSSSHLSPLQASSDQRERSRKEGAEEKRTKEGSQERSMPLRREKVASCSSIEEDAPTAADDSLRSDSIPSMVDEKADSTSVATEYSLKFDESMTEDEIEERSFRSLLPSEAHRRGTLEKKSRPHEESEEETASHDRTLATGAHDRSKTQDVSMAFSGGQDSFSQFTMDMVRQYMKDEEVRLQHQSSLLHLRQKALREKTKTELAWLEHQKRRLRDKGEDDKMPPIRKRQRGLLMKLQQEQAEIKRLQEANKAARKERQLLLKQQQEIERMRNSTLRLKERLKCVGGEAPPEAPMSETPVCEEAVPSMRLADRDVCSPSPPLSVSGSETSSIMQKLKKMRFHMDEKLCSPVHCFFSVFTAHHWASLSVCLPNLHPKFQLFIYNHLVRFLTKREQQLMQRRRHAEELLEWKQRLDQEEAVVRRMEKEALATWDRDREASECRIKESSDVTPSSSHHRSPEHRTNSEKEFVSEEDSSPVTPVSSIHTESSVSQLPESPSIATPALVPKIPLASAQISPSNYPQDFTSASLTPSKRSPAKGNLSTAASQSDSSSRKTKMQVHSASLSPIQIQTQPTDTPTAAQTETMSDQSDIESRIRALKEELRKRKSMAHQLKKEQKKRHKERLKAQEASLLKQLQSYNDFIQKTKAELNSEQDTTPADKAKVKTLTAASGKTKIKPLPPYRSDSSEGFKIVSDSERTRPDSPLVHDDFISPRRSRSTSLPEGLSDEDVPTVTPTPVYGSPERPSSALRESISPQCLSRPVSREDQPLIGQAQPQIESGNESIVSNHRSDIKEELGTVVGDKSEDQHSECLFKLDQEKKPSSQPKLSVTDHGPSSKSEERRHSPSGGLETDEQMKTIESSVVGEDVRSADSHSNRSNSVARETKTLEQPNDSSPSPGRSYIPNSIALSSKKEATIKNAEPSSPLADGYHDDFESSVESSPREVHHSSKSASTSLPSPTEVKASREGSHSKSPLYSRQDEEEVEEDIAEELSEHSGVNGSSHHSGGLLDLHSHTKDDTKEKTIISNHSPIISPSQTPSPLSIDEMPSFNIGDRVLVSNIQPGTLRFKGPTKFANGFWAGVELDKSEGSNNGIYDGVVYFECEEQHGIFAPPDKITHLPEKFEMYTDTTEDEDSFFDDLSDKDGNKREADEKKARNQGDRQGKREETFGNDSASKDKEPTDESDQLAEHLKNQHTLKAKSHTHNLSDLGHPVPNGKGIILEFEERQAPLIISDMDKIGWAKQSLKEITTIIEKKDIDSHQNSVIPVDASTDIVKSQKQDKERLDAFADKLIHNFVNDAVKQITEIKKAKEQKIAAANQMNGDMFGDGVDNEEIFSSAELMDGLPFFLEAEKDELSSPELCNQPKSPVLGPSGQEELAKRLAELELSRELLDDLGDEQDWFDEDFGLSSRREQQRLKQKQREDEEEAKLGGGGGRSGSSVTTALGGLVTAPGGEQQVKTPPRPEMPLPLPPKLPEQPAMVVPHSATEVEKLVHTATQEIWDSCKLGEEGTLTLTQLPIPKPSQVYLGKEANSQDHDALCIRSYRQAVYDLTWEILQEIYAEDPNAHQPQWVKPQRVNSYFHRVKSPRDIAKVQEFITAEVLKLYGLKKDQNQKTDWQKMLKFGRKKRDRVDHILVQELHEEEAQWVNYDEDELFVKMQLANSVFDALLKDTADVLTQIYDKRAKRAALS